jgi:hypothetical protein
MSIPAKTLGHAVEFSAIGARTAASSVPPSGLSAGASAAIAEILADLSEALGNLTWDSMSIISKFSVRGQFEKECSL